MTKIFEVLMLVCFGVSWPINILKSLRTRSAKGKSLLFLCLIFAGYIAGIINNLINGANYVLAVYILNLIMVGIDIILYFRNLALDKKAAQAKD